jgi:anthranilate synthase component II
VEKKRKMSFRLTVIDNYDSFTHNLVQMFLLYDLDIRVHRADMISAKAVMDDAPDYILISPGPKDPANAGISVELVKKAVGRVPLLGVCLGMQSINEAFGGKTVRAPVPVHGKTSRIFHDSTGVFAGLPSPFIAARYHSLAVDAEGTGLSVNAHTEDGVIMGLWNPALRLYGVQFHPESFMTAHGFDLVENFLKAGPLRFETGRRKNENHACSTSVRIYGND